VKDEEISEKEYSDRCTLELAHALVKYRKAVNLLRHWPMLNSAEFGMERDRLLEEFKEPEIEKGEKYSRI